METDFIDEINSKYASMEHELDLRLKKLCLEEERQNLIERQHEKTNHQKDTTSLNLEQAKKRNADVIKSLEMAKARLRSRSTYSPIETILEKALKNYSATLHEEPKTIAQQKQKSSTFL